MGVLDDVVGDWALLEVGALEVGALEVGALEVGALEVGALEVGVLAGAEFVVDCVADVVAAELAAGAGVSLPSEHPDSTATASVASPTGTIRLRFMAVQPTGDRPAGQVAPLDAWLSLRSPSGRPLWQGCARR
jgi:hypothetical protein